jgi:hypothetical protein
VVFGVGCSKQVSHVTFTSALLVLVHSRQLTFTLTFTLSCTLSYTLPTSHLLHHIYYVPSRGSQVATKQHPRCTFEEVDEGG